MSDSPTAQDPPGRFDVQDGPRAEPSAVADLASRARACDDGLISVDPVLVTKIIADLGDARSRLSKFEAQEARVRDALRDSALLVRGLSMVPIAVIRTAMGGPR